MVSVFLNLLYYMMHITNCHLKKKGSLPSVSTAIFTLSYFNTPVKVQLSVLVSGASFTGGT